RGQARDRDRVPGPRARRQPRRGAEHVPRARGARLPVPPQGSRDGAAHERDAQVAGGDDDPLGAAARSHALGRTASVGGGRSGCDVEQPGRLPRRADSGTRRGADPPGAGARATARRAGAGRRVRLAQPGRHLRGRRPHHRPPPRPQRRRLREGEEGPAGDRAGEDRGEGSAEGSGGRIMSTAAPAEVQAAAAGDSLAEILRARWQGIKGGDVGSLPVLIGLIGITLYFTSKSPVFFSAVNFTNLIGQMAGVTVIAIGVVFVLLIGEIDLSIGYVSGLAGVVVAELQVPDSGHQYPGLVAIAAAIAVGAAIGALQGSFVAFIGVPSFVVTLAGLLIWQGV